jgi:hypothetical protein
VNRDLSFRKGIGMRRVVAVYHSRTLIALLLLASLGATSCTSVRLVSDYDEVLDLSVTQMQKDVDTFLIELERDEPSYDESRDFYDRIHVDLRAAQLRAGLNDKNQLTVDMLDAVADNIAQLEKAHREGFQQTAEEIGSFRNAFATQFKAIIKFELAKKRGQQDESP